MKCPNCTTTLTAKHYLVFKRTTTCPHCNMKLVQSFRAHGFLALAVVGTALVGYLTKGYAVEVRYGLQAVYTLAVMAFWLKVVPENARPNRGWSSEGR